MVVVVVVPIYYSISVDCRQKRSSVWFNEPQTTIQRIYMVGGLFGPTQKAHINTYKLLAVKGKDIKNTNRKEAAEKIKISSILIVRSSTTTTTTTTTTQRIYVVRIVWSRQKHTSILTSAVKGKGKDIIKYNTGSSKEDKHYYYYCLCQMNCYYILFTKGKHTVKF